MPNRPADPVSFDAAMTRAEEIVEQLTRGAVGLDDALMLYDEGQALIARAAAQLQRAEQRVKELAERADGSIEYVDVPRQENGPTA